MYNALLLVYFYMYMDVCTVCIELLGSNTKSTQSVVIVRVEVQNADVLYYLPRYEAVAGFSKYQSIELAGADESFWDWCRDFKLSNKAKAVRKKVDMRN